MVLEEESGVKLLKIVYVVESIALGVIGIGLLMFGILMILALRRSEWYPRRMKV